MTENRQKNFRQFKNVYGEEVEEVAHGFPDRTPEKIEQETIKSQTRYEEIESFLKKTGWDHAERTQLAQDASTRRYERLTTDDGSWLLMDAPLVEDPPCPLEADEVLRLSMGWNASSRLAASRIEAFVAISGYLRSLDLSAPEIFAYDKSLGLAIVEDFGENKEIARMIEEVPRLQDTYHYYSVKVLAKIHQAGIPDRVEGFGVSWPIQKFDRLALETQCNLFADWFPRIETDMANITSDDPGWQEIRDELIDEVMTYPRAFTLRDFHAENLIWLPRRQGIRKIGLLDFQDAVSGWDAWDISMLVQDARRNVKPWPAKVAIRQYLEEMGTSEEEFERRLTIVGTLNMFRILGVFSRLCVRDNKIRYKKWIERPQNYIAFNLRHFENANNWLKKVSPNMINKGFL